MGGLAKYQGNEAHGNIWGAISVCSTPFCGVVATALIFLYFSLLGAAVGAECDQKIEEGAKSQAQPDMCTAECQAALHSAHDIVCGVGAALSITGLMLFILIVMGVCTCTMTIVGFCQHKTPPQQQQSPQQQIQLVSLATNPVAPPMAVQLQQTIQVQVPPNAEPGMTLAVQAPDGQQIQFLVPAGAVPFSIYAVPYTTSQMAVKQ